MKYKTRQEAQSLLNQIAQTRNTLKEQELAATAATVTTAETNIVNTVEMEVVNVASETGANESINLATENKKKNNCNYKKIEFSA